MNFLGHALGHLDHPFVVVGTSFPDILSIADRRARLDVVEARRLAQASGALGQIASGILQHLDDDAWFHKTAIFDELVGSIARSFPSAIRRPRFVAHILLELLIDGELIDRDPKLLTRFLQCWAQIDRDYLVSVAPRLTKRTSMRLGRMLAIFPHASVFESYRSDDAVAVRLNRTLGRSRVGRQQLPAEVVRRVRPWVRASLDDLTIRPA